MLLEEAISVLAFYGRVRKLGSQASISGYSEGDLAPLDDREGCNCFKMQIKQCVNHQMPNSQRVGGIWFLLSSSNDLIGLLLRSVSDLFHCRPARHPEKIGKEQSSQSK